SVGLHPSVFGKSITGELFTEVLYHIVTLKFAMYEHVDVQLFLQADRPLRFFGDKLIVFLLRDHSFLQISAPFAHITGLGEGSDCGGCKSRQIKPLLLLGFAFDERAGPLSIFISDSLYAGFYILTVNQLGRTTALLGRLISFKTGLSGRICTAGSQNR